MRVLIATTVVLGLAGLAGVWAASRRHRRAWFEVSGAALALAVVLVAGAVGFPRETCELLGGNLRAYDSGTCVNELGGTTVEMIME